MFLRIIQVYLSLMSRRHELTRRTTPGVIHDE